MEDLPYFKFMVRDYLSGDIQMCSHVTQGIFVNLCCQLWRKGGYLSADSEYLASLLKTDRDTLEAAVAELQAKDILLLNEDNHCYIKFILAQLAALGSLHKERVKSGRKGGKAKQLNRRSRAKAQLEQNPSTALAFSEAEAEAEADKEIPPNPQGGPTKIAKEMLAQIQAATGRKLVAKVRASATAISKLLKEGITEEQIRQTVNWLCAENLTRSCSFDVQSGKALYDKWDRIQAAMCSDNTGPGSEQEFESTLGED